MPLSRVHTAHVLKDLDESTGLGIKESNFEFLFWRSKLTEVCKIIPVCSNFRVTVAANRLHSATACQTAIFGKICKKTINLAGIILHLSVVWSASWSVEWEKFGAWSVDCTPKYILDWSADCTPNKLECQIH